MSIQNNCKKLSSITLFMPFYQGFFSKISFVMDYICICSKLISEVSALYQIQFSFQLSLSGGYQRH